MSLMTEFENSLERLRLKVMLDDKLCNLCVHNSADLGLPNCIASNPHFCPGVQAEINWLEASIWSHRLDRATPWIKK